MRVTLTRSLGLRVLGVWLILHALLFATTYSIPGMPLLDAILAFVAGVLILLGR